MQHENKMDCYLSQKSLKMEVHKQVYTPRLHKIAKGKCCHDKHYMDRKAYINKIETKLAK